MTTTVFDTLSFVKRLKAAGVSESQAEAQAEALAEAVGGALVTKRDFDDGIGAVRRELDQAVRELKTAIENVRRELEARINLMQWMLGFVLALSAAMFVKAFA
jgi:hypothetical protein